jgi:hypothetical protein
MLLLRITLYGASRSLLHVGAFAYTTTASDRGTTCSTRDILFLSLWYPFLCSPFLDLEFVQMRTRTPKRTTIVYMSCTLFQHTRHLWCL